MATRIALVIFSVAYLSVLVQWLCSGAITYYAAFPQFRRVVISRRHDRRQFWRWIGIYLVVSCPLSVLLLLNFLPPPA